MTKALIFKAFLLQKKLEILQKILANIIRKHIIITSKAESSRYRKPQPGKIGA